MPQSQSDHPPAYPVPRQSCPKCGELMFIARLERYDADHDQRTFQCIICDYVETTVVKFK
jgi:ribosomal protein S27AE